MCKIMNVFGQNGRENLWMSSCYSSVSVDFVCDRYSLEESKCKKSFDFACDCSFMSGTMQ